MKTTIFTEAIDLTEASFDPANRVLRDVVLIRAGESKNKRTYPEAVLQSATSIFEGVSAFTDHPDKKQRIGRSIHEFSGVYKNVRYEGGMLKADRYFSKNAAGDAMLAIAEDVVSGAVPRTAVGLSINAAGKAKAGTDGGLIIEAITYAESVDDVVNPAAGGSYAESDTRGDGLLSALLQEMTFEEWYQARPEYAERVKNEMKTVRQDKALTEAQALAERLAGELESAQTALRTLEAARVAEADTVTTLRRELALERVLSRVKLPDDWMKNLREELPKRETSEWADYLDREQKKARAAGHRPAIQGAGQQVHTPLTAPLKPADPLAAARKRLAEAKTPEELRAIQRELGLQE